MGGHVNICTISEGLKTLTYMRRTAESNEHIYKSARRHTHKNKYPLELLEMPRHHSTKSPEQYTAEAVQMSAS
jgi:hypothetical protein